MFEFFKTKYIKNIFSIILGAGSAQIILILASPILTRLYSPDDFGLFALFVAITSILSVIATGRYEIAALMPNKDENAYNLVFLSILICFFFNFCLIFFIFFFGEQALSYFQIPITYSVLYLIPLGVLLLSMNLILKSWHNRKKRFKHIATESVFQSITISVSQSSLSSWLQSLGLIFGQMISSFLSVLYYLRIFLKKDKTKLNKKKIILLMKKYSQYPLIDVPSSLISISANRALNILLASIFSPSVAGFYYLTQRVLQTPITLISGSILIVFRQQAVQDYKKNNHCKVIYMKTLCLLFLIALLPSTILYFWAENLFAFIFGEQWRESGMYAKVLIPALFLRFIANPLSFVIYIAEKQIWNFIANVILLILLLVSVLTPGDITQVIKLIMFSYSFYYVLLILLSFKLAFNLKFFFR